MEGGEGEGNGAEEEEGKGERKQEEERDFESLVPDLGGIEEELGEEPMKAQTSTG